jgi:hypothetical protein
MSKLKIVLFVSPNSFDLNFEFKKRLDALQFIGMFSVGLMGSRNGHFSVLYCFRLQTL